MDGGRRYPRFAFCFPDCVRLLRIAGESVGGGRSAAGCGWPLFPVSRIRAARFSGIAPMPRSVYRRCRTEKIKIGRMMMKVRQISYICTPNAEVAQSVEHQLPKLRVAGSNPVFRSKRSLQTSFFVGGGREGAGRASNPHPADNGNAPANGRIPISAWRNAPTTPDRYRTAVPPSPATGSVQTENRRMQALRAAS